MKNKNINLVVWLAAAITVTACDGGNTVDVVNRMPGQGDHTLHTDVAQGIWPPQPLGMTNVRRVAAGASDGAQDGILSVARRRVLNNPSVRTVLGDDYFEFTGSLGESKGDVAATFMFYSYATDETIETNLYRSGDVQHRTYPASEFQPTEHAREKQRAISLAGNALAQSGFETRGLVGTAMLAYPPATDATDNGLRYYPQRVLYVTFGEGDGELPVYRALANLSTGEVTEQRVIQ